jgi:MPBQ/MSBQ methyltransferase
MLGTTMDYYDGPEVVDELIETLRGAGLDPDALDLDDLAPLDEFHARGRAATLALAELASVRPGEHVLDVGAGIGGPARVLAARRGAQVTALDVTPRFCAVAERLTRGAGLSGRVRVVCGDALDAPFADATFDLAWTQAVAQNIADKERLIAELARVVVPGGRVAMFEIVAGPGGPIEFPVPWADRPDQSWLVSAGELHGLLDTGPLEVVHWLQGMAALEAIGAAEASVVPPGSDRGVGLHLLMPDYEARMATMVRNVAQQRVGLVLAVARRTL